MKTPPCVRALWRAFGFAAVVCLFTTAGYGQHFTGYDLIVPRGAAPNSITSVDGAGMTMPTDRSFVIGIEGGLRNPILLTNWTGSEKYPVMIVNVPGTGRVNISDAVPGDSGANGATGIEMVNCKYVKLRGDNDPAHRYGIEISRAGGRGTGSGPRGVDVNGKSSYIEISHLEIHDVAFAGIMVKQDPSSDPALFDDFNHPHLVYHDIRVHDNYIYAIGGEGMYIGYSKWKDNRNGTGLEFCHNIIGLAVYNNLLADCDWDGIQVGAATEDAAIYNNVIIRSGGLIDTQAPGNGGQGIQLGEGTTGSCYNNIIIRSRTNGITVLGIGNNYVYNNLIVGGILGVFVDSRPDTPVPAGQPADRQTQPGSAFYVFHNTVIDPSRHVFQNESDITDNLFNNNIGVTAANPVEGFPFVYWFKGGFGTADGNQFQIDQTDLNFASANRATDFDYRILTTSVAKDKGVVAGLEPPDFFNVPRPNGTLPDAGYSESGGFSVFLRITPPTSGNNGVIDAAAINGTTPYTYQWSDGNTTNPRTNLAPGYYSVVVTDAAGVKQRRATYLSTGAAGGAPVTFTPLTQVEAPTFNVPAGTYSSAQSVTITSATAGVTIRYTEDGTTPTTTTGSIYSSARTVTSTKTLRAIAYKTGLDPSAVSTATYFIGVPPPASQLTVLSVSDRKTILAWTLPGGANRVELKYATTSGGPYTSLGVKRGTSFEHTGLVNGTTYYYVVLPANEYGVGPVSAQASATPFGFYATRTIISAPPLIAGPTTPSGTGASASGVFDEPPTWDAVKLVPVGNESDTGQANVSATDKYWCIDFGTNYSSFHLTEMWTRYKANSSAPHLGFPEVWWDDDKDVTNDGTSAGTMNFNTATNLPNSSSQQWYRDRDYTSAPITPQNRYLVFKIPPGSDNKPNEMAFVGWQDVTPAAPSFSQHPQSQSVPAGSEVSFTANGSGTPVPTFQWQKNGVNIPGATGQVLKLANVQSTDAGSYTAVATNASGSTTSNAATLTVTGGGAPTLVILTPSAVGTAVPSAACSAIGAFNEQPTWDAVNGVPVGVAASPHTPTSTAYANRTWFIDFGANYANLRITQMWTRYRPNSSGNHPGFGQLWWDNDNDNVNDGTTASTMNFGNGQGLPNVGTQLWVRDRDFTSSPITPLNRYLVVYTGATSPSDRPNEFAFVGYVVP